MSELNITGFSEYLHFYGENQLLGIGWETDPDTGNVTGMKCSMFDISDPSDVRETDRFILKDVSFCDALYNYHRFLQLRRKVCSGLLMESMEITLMYMTAVRIIIMHCFPIMIKWI